MTYSSMDHYNRWEREREEREDRIMSNSVYGPHLGQGEMCIVCKEGRASAEFHCTWCGANFIRSKAYGDHMYAPGNDCFDRMANAIKSVVNKAYPSPVQAERNWQDFVNGLLQGRLWSKSGESVDKARRSFWVATAVVGARGEDPNFPHAELRALQDDLQRDGQSAVNRISRNDGSFR